MSELALHPENPERFWASRGPELAAGIVAVVERLRSGYVELLDLVGELDRAGIHRLAGYSSPAALVSALTRVGARDAKRLVAQAEAVCPTLTPTGHQTPPALPATRVALVDGAIGGDHVEVIARTIRELPTWVDAAARSAFEETLAEQARTADPVQLRVRADRMLAVLDQDGPEPDDRPDAHRNHLSWRKRRDGRIRGAFELCAADAATFEALIEPLSKSEPSDTRSVAERHGDALAQICDLALAAPDLPTESGERPHLNVTIPLAVLESRVGAALLDGAGVLSASAARIIACDAKMLPHVLGGESQILDVGRARYTVPSHLRRALILRDRGCSFPHCDRRPRACHAHHVAHWADGGPTALNNLALLCTRHHRLVHLSEWAVRISADGRAEFTPPAYLDPLRRPQRNTTHLMAA
ncbi:MAG TPA: DUF222 domain-containing protein [Actinokineospora sp.]|nr:DUF222 domain-containing protein [Actinokineospora sp.]